MQTKENNNKKEEAKVIGNPREYIYPQGVKVEVDGFVITDLITILDQLTQAEIKSESKFKYNYLNEKGKVVKSPKQEDLETGKVQKVVDFGRTILEPNLEYSITEKGVAYAELKNFLERIHFENVRDGKAVNYKELSQKPMVDVVSED